MNLTARLAAMASAFLPEHSRLRFWLIDAVARHVYGRIPAGWEGSE